MLDFNPTSPDSFIKADGFKPILLSRTDLFISPFRFPLAVPVSSRQALPRIKYHLAEIFC